MVVYVRRDAHARFVYVYYRAVWLLVLGQDAPGDQPLDQPTEEGGKRLHHLMG